VRKPVATGFALLLGCTCAIAQVSAQTVINPRIEIGFPGEPWKLVFDAVGFKISVNGLQPDRRAYLEASNHSTQVTLSVLLEKVPGKATAEGCNENQKARLAQNVDYKREEIETRETAGMAIVEYTIPEFQGSPIQQRNLFACLPKDDVYIDIHISEIFSKPQQEELLNTVLNSAHFVDRISSTLGAEAPTPPENTAGGNLDYFREGNRYFIQQKYPAAIVPYQKALDAEKQWRILTKNDWRILVDNLGMAYGITGELNRAEETLNYGLSQDPTYPMFYYNLACVSAGRNDMDKTMELLRKAFSYKANVIPSESMPDPRKDDSFKRFMTDQQFREFVDSL
jgi:predicted Zn-dependent protease